MDPPARTAGFTLVELLVVTAIIAILAGLLLPALVKGKIKAQGLQCMTNHRQLVIAWKMYADDNNDKLTYASANPLKSKLDPYVWVLGWLDFDPLNPSNWDVNQDLARSPIWSYCGRSSAIWKCPADGSRVNVNGRMLPRVRSMSMNMWVGGFGGSDRYLLDDGPWKIYLKLGDLADPGPARTFLFLDMREDSIDVGNFGTDMSGWPDHPEQAGFWDFPASYHNRAGGLSFADGHSEIKKWRDDRTMPPLVRDGLIVDIFSSPNNQDILWMQERATRPVR